jgi:hypothetical protein
MVLDKMILEIRRFGIGDRDTLECLLDLDEHGEVIHAWGPSSEHFIRRIARLREMRPGVEFSMLAVVEWLMNDNPYCTWTLYDERWETMLEWTDAPRFFEGNSNRVINQASQVQQLLAKPELHWKKGRSAYELAHAWLKADGVPLRVRNVLDTVPAFAGARFLRAFFEQKTDIRSKGHPSQTDLLVEVKTPAGLGVIGVEGKAGEAFGETVAKWLVAASEGKKTRLAKLCADLDLPTGAVGALRYQLLHRTAATLYEAEARGAQIALMLVHSFAEDDSSFTDFQGFAKALGIEIQEQRTVAGPVSRLGIDLYLGWVSDHPSVD